MLYDIAQPQNRREAAMSERAVVGGVPQGQERALKLLSQLQMTLELPRLLEAFAEEIGKIVAHDSFSYRHAPMGVDIVLGKPAVHRCEYRLVVESDTLGKVEFTRSHPFRATETDEFEELLVALVYPLRNALMYERALQSALKDPLTGLYNRAAMNDALSREIKLARRNKSPVSLILIDIDHFKTINDTYGHSVGDTVLRSLASTITSCIRTTDILARFGGEEFSIVLNNTDVAGAKLLAERIGQAARSASCEVNGKPVVYTISLGVATLQTQDDERSLFERADKGLYEAKRAGRDRVVVKSD